MIRYDFPINDDFFACGDEVDPEDLQAWYKDGVGKDGTKTLYAVWEAKQLNITFVINAVEYDTLPLMYDQTCTDISQAA